MADYSSMEMPQLEVAFYGAFNSYHRWKVAAAAWRAMGEKLKGAQDQMNKSWETAGVMQQNEQEGDSEAYYAFEDAIAESHGSILGGNGGTGWATFALEVGARLDSTAEEIAYNQPLFHGARMDFYAAEDGSSEQTVAKQRARIFVWNVANAVQLTFAGLQVPTAPFEGPMGAAQGDNQTEGGAGDPSAGGPGSGDVGAAGGGDPGDVGGPGGAPGDAPGEAPGDQPKPDEPKPEDPLERTDKFLDVAGKGIDLLGKPADVAGKYIGLAEQLKGLGEDGAGVEEPNLEDLFPDRKFPETEGPDIPDELSLAGGTAAEAPTFRPPDLGSGAGGTGTGGGAGPLAGLGSVGNGGNVGRAGGEAPGTGGGMPSLAGRTTSNPGTSTQSGMPPMYPPPMGGMGAAGPGGGQGGIKPGQAQSRGGFDVAKAQPASEQLRRQGVQEDLQGRTNGEQRPASAVRQTRKRKDRGRTGAQTEQGVLDEELWRL